MEKVCIICYQICTDLCSFAPFACIFWDRLFRLCFRERLLEVKLQRFSCGQSIVVMVEAAPRINYFFTKTIVHHIQHLPNLMYYFLENVLADTIYLLICLPTTIQSHFSKIKVTKYSNFIKIVTPFIDLLNALSKSRC